MAYKNPYVDKELNRRLGVNEDAMHITQADLEETKSRAREAGEKITQAFYGMSYDEYEANYAYEMLPLHKKLGLFLKERFTNKKAVKNTTTNFENEKNINEENTAKTTANIELNNGASLVEKFSKSDDSDLMQHIKDQRELQEKYEMLR